MGGALDVDAEVDEAAEVETPQAREVLRGEAAEIVGAKDAPPARAPAAGGRIAAEVAEVDRAFEVDASGWLLGHRRAITRPAGRRMSYSM